MSKRVLLGMSGGVDSSVSAILLKKSGYDVIGVTMNLCGNQEQTINDAKKVCEKLQIEHNVLDLRNEFQKKVIDNFKTEYREGKTPNPCVECNKYIKFGELYKYAKDFNCDFIATGHYAKVLYSEQYNQYVLAKSEAIEKDQTYFLYGIDRNILSKVLFPLGNFRNKEEIRNIAKENNLEVANKKDSQEICFIQNNNYVEFLQRDNSFKNQKIGNIVLRNGTILGKHKGLINYTVGQRKGLGISYKEPLYVLEIDNKVNQVVVGTEEDLYSKVLYAENLNFLIDLTKFEDKINIKAKIRYRSKEADAILSIQYQNGKRIAKVEFNEFQRAITRGQSVVFYIGNIVLGGGKIL